jgi:hypothetical protein
MERLCHNCNAPQSETAKFCANCGTQVLVTAMPLPMYQPPPEPQIQIPPAEQLEPDVQRVIVHAQTIQQQNQQSRTLISSLISILRDKPKSAGAKRTKRIIIIGMVLLGLGTLRFVSDLIGLAIMERPSASDYNIWDSDDYKEYEDAVQSHEIIKGVAPISILITLVIMIIGIVLIIVNYKRMKE